MQSLKKILTQCLGLSVAMTVSVSALADLQINNQPATGLKKAQISWSDTDAKQLLANDTEDDNVSLEGSTVVSITQRPSDQTPSNHKISDTQFFNNAGPIVRANAALVMDAQTGEVLFSKNSSTARPMASITKLMTAVVVADARLDMAEPITLEPIDFVGPKAASTKLRVGDEMNRAEVLLMALMRSENPAAAALARAYPGGKDAFIRAMNAKARELGMSSTHYFESTGLDVRNVSSARDLAILVAEAYKYGVIRQFSSTQHYDFNLGYRMLNASNTNALVRNGGWNINLSKTGFINEAGRCVVMHTTINSRPAVVVLMGEPTTEARNQDATDLLTWLSALPKYA